jgi:hypothetical protein
MAEVPEGRREALRAEGRLLDQPRPLPDRVSRRSDPADQTWQIWNEQNIQRGRQRVLPRKYARLVRLSHNAIDAANPRAKILLGGMPGYIRSRAWVYLNKLYKRHGLKRKFDAVALHPYSPDVGHVLVQIKQMRRVMRKHHDAGAGLWITELGWGSKRPSEGQPINKGLKGQKRLLKATFPILKRYHRRWNLRHAFWFRWRDPPHGTGGVQAHHQAAIGSRRGRRRSSSRRSPRASASTSRRATTATTRHRLATSRPSTRPPART